MISLRKRCILLVVSFLFRSSHAFTTPTLQQTTALPQDGRLYCASRRESTRSNNISHCSNRRYEKRWKPLSATPSSNRGEAKEGIGGVEGAVDETDRVDHPRPGWLSSSSLSSFLPVSDHTLGILVLLTVPLSWGTYGPTVRYLYEIQPPVPGFVFSACYYTLAAGTMLLLSWTSTDQSQTSTATIEHINGDDDDDDVTATTSELFSSSSSSSSSSFPIIGGIELGMYLFLANCLQVIGLQTVPSDRAGFLVQLTTVFVPFAEALFRGNLLAVPLRTWGACFLAFLGINVMGLDGKEDISTAFKSFGGADGASAATATAGAGAGAGAAAAGAASDFANGNPLFLFLSESLSSLTQGDLFIVSAAVLYTLHVVRLGRYAKETTPLRLAAVKATTEAIFSVSLVVILVVLSTSSAAAATGTTASSGLLQFSIDTGNEILAFSSSLAKGLATRSIPMSTLLPAVGATLWTGWITCGYTIYAQSFGQSRVRYVATKGPTHPCYTNWIFLRGGRGIF
jgi:hypothetical protein